MSISCSWWRTIRCCLTLCYTFLSVYLITRQELLLFFYLKQALQGEAHAPEANFNPQELWRYTANFFLVAKNIFHKTRKMVAPSVVSHTMVHFNICPKSKDGNSQGMRALPNNKLFNSRIFWLCFQTFMTNYFELKLIMAIPILTIICIHWQHL